ncbi:MAG: hypothetical protein Q4E45_05305 [Eubacteriales bacterium]|nr:hypothetical protein [Eubacteriales bacterium]
MDRETINAYLTDALAEITAENTPGFDRYMGVPDPFKGRGPELAARSATRLLPIRQAHREAEPKEKESYRDAWQNAKNALLQCGKLLEEDDFAGVLTGVIRAGIKDMNPAVVVIDVEQENLKISAYAKEGLFSQHTAEKAIDKLLQAL